MQENEDFDFIAYDDDGRIDVNSIEDFYKDSSVAALLADDTGIADHAMCITGLFEPLTRKRVFRLSDQVRHKPGCTATEDCFKREISDLGSRGIVLSM